ncbi:MAG: hypothetical protein GY847_14205 [Proteobacteria bacterium]|nr:hypothetical protein [Pseudomonadota bacterium]
MDLASETTINLTTLALVKNALDDATFSAADDVILTAYIVAWSQKAMKLMWQPVETKERTEYFDVAPGQCEFVVQAQIDTGTAPVLVNNTSRPRDWTVTAVDSDYVVYTPDLAIKGRILVETTLTSGRQALRVVYDGGMAADSAAFVAKYEDIAESIAQQVAFIWQSKMNFHIQSEAVIGMSRTYNRPMSWLPHVKDILEQHRGPQWRPFSG